MEKNAPAEGPHIERNMAMIVAHQNYMLALRRLMGWPPFKPANDCIAFTSGKPADLEIGIELGRIAQMLCKDLIYSGWTSVSATSPASFTVAWRTILTVDIANDLVPYAANDRTPVVLIDMRRDTQFAIDDRGSLVRTFGRPKSVSAGRRLAAKRIKTMAKTINDELLKGNRHVGPGADTIEPQAPAGNALVRFG